MLPFIQSAYFQDLLDGYPESVVIFNTDGYAYACNHSARNLLGITCDEDFKGRLWDELLPGIDDQAAFLDYIRQSHDHASRRTPLEAGYTTQAGERLRLSLTTSLLVEYHKIFGILLSMTDVTHIYAMHERQRRFLEERHAMERDRTKSLAQLSDAVAHQLRNPAMAIAGFARIALRKAESNLHEYLDGILEESVRLEAIVHAVSSFNAIHAAPAKRILLTDLVGRAVAETLHRGPVAWSSVPLIVDVEETAVTIDTSLATELLIELLINSLDAVASHTSHKGQPPGEVYVGAGVENGLRFEIADNGPGIPSDILPFVFDPFYTTKPDSVGMGLTRARRMAAELGLDITLQRSDSGGVLTILDEREDEPEDAY